MTDLKLKDFTKILKKFTKDKIKIEKAKKK